MTCVNCEKGKPPFHNLSAEGDKPRLVCHWCWTLDGLLGDKQRKAEARDIFSGLVKTKREGRGKPHWLGRAWRP